MKFAIVGLGSIGKRHKKNLELLGHQIIPCHRNDNLEKLLKPEKADGVLVCNPTALHIPTALVAVEIGCHIFIEKPISHNLDGVDKLLKLVKNKKLVLQVGHEMRLHPGIIKLKQQLDKKVIGKVYSARIEAGQYLPDWRPGQDYKKSYSAKKELGGGVLLDLSHEIDYAVWFFGRAKKVLAMIKKVPELEIETEALVEMLIEFKSGVIAEIHLDYLQRQYRRSCQIIGSQGNLFWEDKPAKNFDPNQPYVEEIKNFVAAIKGEEKPKGNGEENKHVLEIIMAAKKSAKLEKTIKL